MRSVTRGSKISRLWRVALGALLLGPALAVAAPVAAVAGPGDSGNVAGTFQSELGCGSDWNPACPTTALIEGLDGRWRATVAIPAGAWEYKAVFNGVYFPMSPAGNLLLSLAAPTVVTFYFDPTTNWATDNHSSVIVTAIGDFQSELGCASDWNPSCLRTWLQDPDGNGIYTFVTMTLPAGTYAAKAAINEGLAVVYGAGGESPGFNIVFVVPPGATVTFSFNSVTHLLTINSVTGTPATPTPAATTPAATTPPATTPAVTTPPATTPRATTPAATTPGLPATGSTAPMVLAVTGAAVLLAGAGLVLMGRRRRLQG